MPVLGWNPVPGAASYDVDVALYESGNCAYGSGSLWRVKTSVPFWTPLGVGPAPEPYDVPNIGVSSDGASLTAGKGYCARVRARSDRDSANAEVFGDYTGVNDGTGKAFTFLGFPDTDREGHGSYLAASDYLLPQTGSMNGRTPFFSWKPLSRLARKTLRNTSNAEALTITEPSNLATFSATVRDHAGNTALDELVLTKTPSGGPWVYTYPDGDLNALEAMVENDPAHTLAVEVHVTGMPLALISDAAFTSGPSVVLRPRLEGRELQQHRRLRVHPAACVRTAASGAQDVP